MTTTEDDSIIYDDTATPEATAIAVALSPDETATLARLEAVIDRAAQTFIDIGNALHDIRDGRLYRQTHDTFESYCKSRLGFTPRRAGQYISGAITATAIGMGTQVPIGTERHARALAPLLEQKGADVAREVWITANEKRKPTAYDVEAAAHDVINAEQIAADRAKVAKLTAMSQEERGASWKAEQEASTAWAETARAARRAEKYAARQRAALDEMTVAAITYTVSCLKGLEQLTAVREGLAGALAMVDERLAKIAKKAAKVPPCTTT